MLAGGGWTGSGWSTLASKPGWTTAQPAWEVTVALLDEAMRPWVAGAIRAVSLGLVLLCAAWACRLWMPNPVGVAPWVAFATSAYTAMGIAQERPQQVSLLAYPAVGVLLAVVAQGRLATMPATRFRGVVCATAVGVGLWTLWHQGWQLAVGSLVVACALAPGGAYRRRGALVAATCVAIATPVAWRAIEQTSDLSTMSAVLVEWQPVGLMSAPGAGAVVLIVAFVSVAVVRRRPTVAEVAVLTGLSLTAAWAARGIAPAVLLGAPMLARWSPLSSARFDVRWPVWAVPGATVAACLPAGWIAVSSAMPSAADEVAADAAMVSCSTAAHQVIATRYEDSGAALVGARRSGCHHAESTRVVLDGRADRYGLAGVLRWQRALAAAPDWKDTLTAAGVTAAILPPESPLAGVLRAEGWRVVDDRGMRLVLMAPQ